MTETDSDITEDQKMWRDLGSAPPMLKPISLGTGLHSFQMHVLTYIDTYHIHSNPETVEVDSVKVVNRS